MTCKHWIKNTWWASHLLLALLYCWSQPSLSGAKEVDRLTTSSREESSGFQTGGQQGEEEEEMSANQNHSANHLSCCKPFLEYKAQEQGYRRQQRQRQQQRQQAKCSRFLQICCLFHHLKTHDPMAFIQAASLLASTQLFLQYHITLFVNQIETTPRLWFFPFIILADSTSFHLSSPRFLRALHQRIL